MPDRYQSGRQIFEAIIVTNFSSVYFVQERRFLAGLKNLI